MQFSPDERTSPPFAWFFLFASLDAAAGVGVLLLYFVSGVDLVSGGTDSLFAWHGRELVFGYAPGVCTGFLLTALPRWTQRTPGPISETVLLLPVARSALRDPVPFRRRADVGRAPDRARRGGVVPRHRSP
ncbi:MAG: NnrS family protein [Rhodoplanes sp.]